MNRPVNIREYYEKDEQLLFGKMAYLSQDITFMVEANVVNAFWEIFDKQSLSVDGFGGQNGGYSRILRKRWTYATWEEGISLKWIYVDRMSARHRSILGDL